MNISPIHRMAKIAEVLPEGWPARPQDAEPSQVGQPGEWAEHGGSQKYHGR